VTQQYSIVNMLSTPFGIFKRHQRALPTDPALERPTTFPHLPSQPSSSERMHSLNKHPASFHNLSASESETTLIRLQLTCAALQSFSPPSETFELQN
jgi:hypothetical protein